MSLWKKLFGSQSKVTGAKNAELIEAAQDGNLP